MESHEKPGEAATSSCCFALNMHLTIWSATVSLPSDEYRRGRAAPSVSRCWEHRDQVEPSASVPVGCGGSSRVLARCSRGILKGTGGSPLERTFGSFSSVRKGTRGARRNAPVILAAHGRQFPFKPAAPRAANHHPETCPRRMAPKIRFVIPG